MYTDEAEEIMDTLAGTTEPCPRCLLGNERTNGKVLIMDMAKGKMTYQTCTLCGGKMKVSKEVDSEYKRRYR